MVAIAEPSAWTGQARAFHRHIEREQFSGHKPAELLRGPLAQRWLERSQQARNEIVTA